MIDLIINEIKKDRNTVSKFIADNSKFKQGIYLKVNIDEPFNKSAFKDFFVVDNKDGDTSKYICDLASNDRLNLIDYVKSRLNMNRVAFICFECSISTYNVFKSHGNGFRKGTYQVQYQHIMYLNYYKFISSLNFCLVQYQHIMYLNNKSSI